MKRPAGKKTKKRLPVNTRPTTKKTKKKVAKKVIKRPSAKRSAKSKFVAKAKQVAENATNNPYVDDIRAKLADDIGKTTNDPYAGIDSTHDPIAPLQEASEVEQALEPQHVDASDDSSATDDGSVSEGGN